MKARPLREPLTDELVLLAGGLGTRLREVVSDVPKPLALVSGKPFIGFLIRYFRQQGIRRFIVSVGYKGELIQAYCEKELKGVQIEFCTEEEPLGTGGALKKALELAKRPYAFVSNADSFLEVDLRMLSSATENPDIVIALTRVQKPARYGGIQLGSDGRIRSFAARDALSAPLINGGIYLLRSHLLGEQNCPDKFSLEKDFLEPKLSSLSAWGLEFPSSNFIDIGVPEDYARAQKMAVFS